MSATNVEVGNRLMDRISAELGLSECGKDWCTVALDPYHDTPVEHLMGYPDVNEASSVIQCVKGTYQISAPNTTDGNWDCHIASIPFIDNNGSSIEAAGFQQGFFTVNPTPPNTVALGGLCYDAVPAGNSTFQAENLSIVRLDTSTNSTYTQGEWRQIAHGFEVINTTSDLNVQGLVTCYRAPVPARGTKSTTAFYNYVSTGAGALYTGAIETILLQAPPGTLSDAMLLAGSVQWKAKEGAYVVPTLNSDVLPAGQDNTTPIVVFKTGPKYVAYGVANASPTGATLPTGGSQFFQLYGVGSGFTDFNIGGAYFTGLSNSSTLTVNVIRYYERFPSVDISSDSQLVVLAKPSCRHDPTAIELYSAVIRHMPVGVPQRFNGLGDWFKEAVQTARDIVSPVLSAIPNPLAQMGSMLLKGVAGNIDKKYAQEEKVAVVPPGRIYNAQGNQSVTLAKVAKPKKNATVVKQLASLGLGKKKKKKNAVAVAAMAKKK